jgi:23S rRNA (cytosine1962-C5)-methyltransferase
LREQLTLDDVLFRADERVQAAEGFTITSAAQGPTRDRAAARQSTIITEHGLRFQIDLTHGHKTGFFCDQRDNRLALTRLTPDCDVLDVCSYSGGFGVHAAALGKAKSVTCIDLDEDAIALAQRNANLNQVAANMFSTVHSDAFTYLRQMQANGRQFNVVVVDPPKFVPNRESFFEGRGKYFDLNRLALTLLKPGGYLVTCSCSGLVSGEEFLGILRGAARSAQRRVQVFATTGPGPDHPVMTDTPESAYLKCLWCRVVR